MAKNPSSSSCDALVVGAGPTGLVMANELLRHGVRVRIIDKSSAPSDKSKALAVQVRSQEIFEDMGVIDEALAQGRPIKYVNAFMEGRQMATVEFKGLESPYPYPLMLEQSETERILIESLKEKGVGIQREMELVHFEQDISGIKARLRSINGEEEEITIPWLLGCDGSHSIVRHTLDLPFQGSPYPETFVLADVKVDWDLVEDEIYVFLKHEGLMAVFPMKEKKRFRIMGIRSAEDPDANREVTLEEIQNTVDEFSPSPGKVYDPHWLAQFHLHRRRVPYYRVGRAFVAGDAAHIHSPVGGQGMNTGIQDAYNLAWKLGLVVKGSANDSILDTYSAERHPVGERVIQTTDRFFDLITSKNPLIKFAKNHVLPHVASLLAKMGGRTMAEYASEIKINYRKSPLSSEPEVESRGSLWNGPKAGDRAPDGELILGGRKKGTRLFQVFQHIGHTLLIFRGTKEEGPDWEPFIELVNDQFSDLIKLYGILPHGSPDVLKVKNIHMLEDPGEKVHERYGAGEGAIYLIRPDGYVAYRAPHWAVDQLVSYLDQFYLG